MSTRTLPVGAELREPAKHVRWWVPYGWMTGAVALAWIVMHVVRPVPIFPLDDPYITLHSAQVLHWGFDPNYPGVPALFGVTSAPFLGLIYLLLFFLHPLYAIDTGCWLGTLFYALGLVFLARTLRLGRYEGLAVIALGLTSSFVPFHLLNGLETSWAMAGILWTLALGSGAQRLYRWSALCAGMTAAIRPDLLPFAAFVVIALAVQGYQGGMSVRASMWRLLRLGLLATLVVAPFALWYLFQTGHAYPLTGIAKEYYFATGHLSFIEKIKIVRLPVAVFVLTCGPILLGLARVARRPLALAILASMGFMLANVYVQFPDAVGWNRFRYVVVLVPMLVWAMAFATSEQKAKRGLALAVLYSGFFLVYSVMAYAADCRFYGGATQRAAIWCKQNLPSNARVLVQDAGYIAYATPFHIVDYVGLKTPDAIALNKQYTWPSAGDDRAEAVAALALKQHCDYLVTLSERSVIVDLPDQMEDLGWRVEPLKSYGLYRVYALRAPEQTGTLPVTR